MITRRQFIKYCIGAITGYGLSQAIYPLATSSGTANRNIPVLLYHRVGSTSGALTVTPQRLANDLALLQRAGYQTITIDQFEQFLFDRDNDIPNKPVLITFDDGYLDNYQNAFPILQQYSMVATFYIITGMMKDKERVTAQHIQEMAKHGMSIGSHTVSHRSLGEIAPADMRQEITASRVALEDILGSRVHSIAYPKGSFNQNTLAIVQETGYSEGFTVISGMCSKVSNPFVLKRIPVFSYDVNAVALIEKQP